MPIKFDEREIIVCPKCGCEYLPEEIFYPEDLLGKAHDIVKDGKGKLLGAAGGRPAKTEEFVCEKCGATFKVEASVSFSSSIDPLKDLSDDYVTPLYPKPRVSLPEPDGAKEEAD